MIQYIKRENLDVDKYDKCIQESLNSRVYAFSWYLDSVADNWDALILDDYKAVMPLPWRQKYFIKYIYPPAWTQQLGVFSSKKVEDELVLQFLKVIPKKFKKITIQFNSENKFQHKNLTERTNYILPLNRDYKEICNNYRKDRAKRIRQGTEHNLSIIDNVDLNKIIKSFIKNYFEKVLISQPDFKRLKTLFTNNSEEIKLLGVVNERQELISSVILISSEKRVVVLFSSTNQEGLDKNAFSLLINSIIESASNSNLVLDFEGSDIKSIASFNKSFGAERESYFLFKQSFNF